MSVFPLSQICLKYKAHVALLDIEGVPLHIKVAEECGHVVPSDDDVVLGAIKEVVVVKHFWGANTEGRVPLDNYG